MSVNKAILVGRLGRDPETRYTSAGQAVCNFTLATDETYRDRNGERQKRTEWHRIVVWGKQAEIAQQYLHKGSLIFVEGRIQTRQWDDREGQKRTTVEIVANNFRMLGGRAEGGMAAGAGAGAGAVAGESATLDRTKLVSRPVPVRGQVRFRSALAELLRRQGEALGPNSWNGTSLSGDDRSCQYPVSKRKRDSSSLPPQHAQRRRVLGTPSLRSSE